MPKYEYNLYAQKYSAAASSGNELALLTPQKAKAYMASEDGKRLKEIAEVFREIGVGYLGPNFLNDLARARNTEEQNKVVSEPFVLEQLDRLLELGKEPHVKYGSAGKPYFDEGQKKWRAKEPEVIQPLNEKDAKLLNNLKDKLMVDLKKAGVLKIDYTPEIECAQGLFARLSKGDTAGYDNAQLMAADIRQKLKEAGTDASKLDTQGKKPAEEMDKMLTALAQVADTPKTQGGKLQLPTIPASQGKEQRR